MIILPNLKVINNIFQELIVLYPILLQTLHNKPLLLVPQNANGVNVLMENVNVLQVILEQHVTL